MTVRDQAADRTIVDPERHDGATSGAKGDPTGTDFQEVLEAEAERSPSGLLAKVWDALVVAGTPVEKPNVIDLSDDEQLHRLVDKAALGKLAESFERLIDNLPDRVEVAPSEVVTFDQTSVGTGSPATVLIGRQADRLRVRIRNTEASGGNSIFLGTGPDLTTDTGFEVPADSEIVIETRAAIYGVAESAAVTVGLVIEFGDRDNSI